MDINDISKKDKYWRFVAFNICKDLMLADDLVQEMYLKIFDIKEEKNINDYYVVMTINNLFLDICRKRNILINIDDLFYLKDETKIFELNDYEFNILKRTEKLKWWQQKLIEENYDKSLKDIEKEFNINYGFVYRELLKSRKFILQEDFEKKYKNKRFKNCRQKNEKAKR